MGILRLFYVPAVPGNWGDVLVFAGLLFGGLICGITGLVKAGSRTGKSLSIAAIVLAVGALVVTVAINFLVFASLSFLGNPFEGQHPF